MNNTIGRPQSRRVLSIFLLAMINVAAVVSLRSLPMMANYGFALVFFYVVAALAFFVPTALVSAELATGWPKTGGVYVWVKEALGGKWGFMAIWLQWFENVIWYPTVLTFTAATFAYVFDPSFAENKIYSLAVILVSFWGATLLNMCGMKASGLISTVGVIAGTILPGGLIILLAVVWLALGNPSHVNFSFKSFLPDISNIQTLVFASGVLLGMAGMEMSAAHAQEVQNPQKNFPRAIFLSAIIIIVVFILGSLGIAIVVPQKEISLTAGIMDAFGYYFKAYHMGWLIPILAFLTAVGALGTMSTWIVGPTKGVFATARDGEIPPVFQKLNKNGMPANLLIFQAVIVTALSLVFLFMPSVNASYWILAALTSQLYLIMYILMFISAIVLRYKRPDVPRSYRVPGGFAGMWIVSGVGLIASVAAIILGFFPPEQIKTGSLFFYESFLIIGTILSCALAFVIQAFKKPEWAVDTQGNEDSGSEP